MTRWYTHRFLLALLCAATIAFVGCKKEEDSATPMAGGGETPAAASGGQNELNLFCWSEYVPKDVLEKFTAETGIKVNEENYAANEEMLAKLTPSSTYDLLQPSEYTVEALVRQNRLAKLDWSKIPEFSNIAAEFKNRPHDPAQEYSVPWMAGTVVIIYNTEKIKDEIKGFKDVFSGKYNGDIVVLDDNREIVSWALATLGISANDITDDTLAKVEPVLKTWLPMIKAFDSDSPKDKLMAGDMNIGIVWNGEAALVLNEQPGKWKVVVPSEGAHQYIDSFVIPVNAPNKEAAHKFLNFTAKPEIALIIATEFPYTSPNAGAKKLMSKEMLENPASFPPGEIKYAVFKDIGDEAAGKIDALMTKLRNQ